MFDVVYGCCLSLPDGVMRATEVSIGGKRAPVGVGKGSPFAMRGAGARVLVSECFPACALQSSMEGFQVLKIDDDATGQRAGAKAGRACGPGPVAR